MNIAEIAKVYGMVDYYDPLTGVIVMLSKAKKLEDGGYDIPLEYPGGKVLHQHLNVKEGLAAWLP